MSIMFRPPIAAVRTIGWRQVFGFAQGSDPFWGQVRAAQLGILNRNVPFNIVVLGLNVLAVVLVLRDFDEASFLAGWVAGLSLLFALRFVAWRARRASVSKAGVSTREFWRVSIEMIAYGVFLAALTFHLLPRLPVEMQALLMLMSVVAMGGCAFATAITPTTGILLVLTIATGTFGLPAASPFATPTMLIGLLSFVLLITRGMMVTCRGLMVRMATEADSAEQGAIIKMLLSEFEAHGSDWLFEVDAGGLLTRVSPRFVEVAGRPHDTILGMPMIELLGDDRRGRESRAAVLQLNTYFFNRQSFRDLVIPVPAGEATRWWQLSGTPKYDGEGVFTGYRGVGSDVTETRLADEHIVRLAQFDSLTGLPNRRGIRDRISEALRDARRKDGSCALLFIDLDRFKLVNDSLGHRAGDLLLCDVANRLRETLGEVAGIGRLGGDEFAVVLPATDERAAERAARVIVAVLAQPFEVDGQPVSIGASVGFALGPVDGASVDLLLRSADLALYEVKGSGRGHACRFVPAIQVKAEERRALEFDLRGALDRGELALAFQPVIEATDERVVGFEALLRWRHPLLGMIPPMKFIPIAEETGLINVIGQWVIEEACRWAAHWPDKIRIAVNLSPVQFDDKGLVDIVAAALADNGIAPDRLELEITESLFLNEKPATIAMLASLKALGIRFALDDFGTGYSSLGYLHKTAFSRIKIDRSFVSRATLDNGESVAIIRAIVGLAGNLGMLTTAEGTETRAEFEVIRDLGCDNVQGYLFGRPMSPEAATELVAVAAPMRLALVR